MSSNPFGDGDETDPLAWMDDPGEARDEPARDPSPEASPAVASDGRASGGSRRRGVPGGYMRRTLVVREDHMELLDRLAGIEKLRAGSSDDARTKRELTERAFELLFEEEASALDRFAPSEH